MGTEGVGADAEDPAYVLSKASFLSSGVFVANAISGGNADLFPVTTALAMERLVNFGDHYSTPHMDVAPAQPLCQLRGTRHCPARHQWLPVLQ